MFRFSSKNIFDLNSLNELVLARDKWLSKNGLMLPDRFQLCLAAIQDDNFHQQFYFDWKNVYDFNMSIIGDAFFRQALQNDCPTSLKFLKNKYKNHEFDLTRVTCDYLNRFEVQFFFKSSKTFQVSAVFAYVKIEFQACHSPIVLNFLPTKNICSHLNGMSFYFSSKTPFYLSTENDFVLGIFKCEKSDVTEKTHISIKAVFNNQEIIKNKIYSFECD